MATKKGKQTNVRKPYDTPFFHLDQVMVIPYLKQCRICRHDSPKNMLCANCKGSYYCSKECQQKDWQSHKTLCKQIRTALDKCAKEEDNLHHYDEYEDGSTIMDYFDPKHGIVGSFWSFPETRPYCRALGDVINIYRKQHPREGMAIIPSMHDPRGTFNKQALRESALACMKLLSVNRGDNMAFRETVTYTWILLDQDQLAYDLLKWFNITKSLSKDVYDPYLEYWQSDRSEPLIPANYTLFYGMSLYHLCAYALIKIRLYCHFVNVDGLYTFLGILQYCGKQSRNTNRGRKSRSSCFPVLAELAGHQNVLHLIKSFLLYPQNLPSSKFSIRNKEIIKEQAIDLLDKGHEGNNRIWKAFMKPKKLMLQPRPQSYGAKSAEEAYYAIEEGFPVWINRDNEDAFQFLAGYVEEKYHGDVSYDPKMKDMSKGLHIRMDSMSMNINL